MRRCHLEMETEEPLHLQLKDERADYSNLDALIQLRMRSRKGRKIRSRNKILYAILEACHSPAVEHWIMIKARVGYQSFVKHMDRLLSEGKVSSSRYSDEHGRRTTYYTLTNEGLQMLEKLKNSENT
jgi:predicted transcriptional regulator